jgi:hypothetical protein
MPVVGSSAYNTAGQITSLVRMAALQGLSSLFGVDTNLRGRTLGIPSELLNVRANASRTHRILQLPGLEPRRHSRGLPGLFL